MNRRVKRQQKELENVFKLLGLRGARWWAAAAIVLLLAIGQMFVEPEVGQSNSHQNTSNSIEHPAGTARASDQPAQNIAKAGSRYTGKVVKVADGDTVTVVDSDGGKHKVRLLGIDAPETRQAHGQDSFKWLNNRLMGQTIQVEVHDVDRYGREVGKLRGPAADCAQKDCPLNTDINLESVSLGHSWWYRAYSKDQPAADRPLYESAEQKAQTDKLGLWNRPNPLAPWDWRKQQRSN